ncbi:hypothetical protein [Devosia aquimaris]|uniref:hypothetical protein n=1 Tax=Devosia aquimaris TaxID=2866214 RepID=UPI001CD0CFC8|nr:hypothetical protein [Devosia sp. CJK-A8-3]
MGLPDRRILLGMFLGAISATALAATGPGAVLEVFADEAPQVVAPGFDTSKLVRFEGRTYAVTADAGVSQEPLTTQTVKKIEGGRVSYVTITTTATGTYSSDAMFSPNVQYPGIDVEELSPFWFSNVFYSWNGRGWSSFSSRQGNSYMSYRQGNTRVSTYGGTTCISGPGYFVC